MKFCIFARFIDSNFLPPCLLFIYLFKTALVFGKENLLFLIKVLLLVLKFKNVIVSRGGAVKPGLTSGL